MSDQEKLYGENPDEALVDELIEQSKDTPIDPIYASPAAHSDIIQEISRRAKWLDEDLRPIHRLMSLSQRIFSGKGMSPMMRHMVESSFPLVTRHVSVVGGRIENAILKSGTLLTVTAMERDSEAAAERITRYLDLHVAKLGSNMQGFKRWIKDGVKFGTGILKVCVENANVPIASSSKTTPRILGRRQIRWKRVRPDLFLCTHDIDTIEDQPYVIEVQHVTDGDIKIKKRQGLWDEDACDKALNSNGVQLDRTDDKIGYGHPFYATLRDGYGRTGGEDVLNRSHEVLECWYPDGRKVTVVDRDIIVEYRQTIHTRENGGPPYAAFHYLVDSGYFFAQPLPWTIIGLQKEINDKKSLALTAAVTALMPPTFVDVRKLNHPSDYQKIYPGSTLLVNGNPKDIAQTMMMPAGNYQAAIQDIGTVIQQAEYADGVTEAVTGTGATSHVSATTAKLQSQSASTPFDTVISDNLDNIVRLGNLSLLLLRSEVNRDAEEAMPKADGSDFYFIQGEDFDSNVRVEADLDPNIMNPEGAAGNLIQYLQILMQGMQAGIPTDPNKIVQLQDYIARVLSIPDKYFSGGKNPLLEVRGDMMKMRATGVPSNVNPNSDHRIHVAMKMAELPNMPSDVQDAVATNAARHLLALQNNAYRMGSIKAPIYADEEDAKEAIINQDVQEFEQMTGISLDPSPQVTPQAPPGVSPEGSVAGMAPQPPSPQAMAQMPPMQMGGGGSPVMGGQG